MRTASLQNLRLRRIVRLRVHLVLADADTDAEAHVFREPPLGTGANAARIVWSLGRPVGRAEAYWSTNEAITATHPRIESQRPVAAKQSSRRAYRLHGSRATVWPPTLCLTAATNVQPLGSIHAADSRSGGCPVPLGCPLFWHRAICLVYLLGGGRSPIACHASRRRVALAVDGPSLSVSHARAHARSPTVPPI